MLDSLFLFAKVQHHKASMTKVQIPERNEWQLKLQSVKWSGAATSRAGSLEFIPLSLYKTHARWQGMNESLMQ